MAKKHPTKKWPFKFVEVVWQDIVSSSKWRSTLKPPELPLVHQRGWLVADEDNRICIASCLTERDEEDKMECPDDIYDMGDSHTIPRGCIVSIREVRG